MCTPERHVGCRAGLHKLACLTLLTAILSPSPTHTHTQMYSYTVVHLSRHRYIKQYFACTSKNKKHTCKHTRTDRHTHRHTCIHTHATEMHKHKQNRCTISLSIMLFRILEFIHTYRSYKITRCSTTSHERTTQPAHSQHHPPSAHTITHLSPPSSSNIQVLVRCVTRDKDADTILHHQATTHQVRLCGDVDQLARRVEDPRLLEAGGSIQGRDHLHWAVVLRGRQEGRWSHTQTPLCY